MAEVIGIIHVKGGTGRSTIATNLAASLARKGKTLLIDCDRPQGSSMSWYSMRSSKNKAEGLSIATAQNIEELLEIHQGFDASYDFMILDAPPSLGEITRAMLMLCDLLIIPLGASATEIWATTDLLETIKEAKESRPQLDSRILWNRFRSHTQSAPELYKMMNEDFNQPEFLTKLSFRVAYADALGKGLSVLEWRDPTAKAEINALTNEIIEILQ